MARLQKFASLATVAVAAAAALNVGSFAVSAKAAAQAQKPAKRARAQKAKVVLIDLNGALQARPHGFHLSLLNLGPSTSPNLATLTQRLLRIQRDKSIAGVELNLQDFSLSFTQAEELGELLRQLRHAHKRVITYSDSYETDTYLLASYGDTIAMPRSGDLFIPGVQLQLMFFKGLLKKLDVQADMVQIGKYKGAQEPLTRNSASTPFRDDVQKLVDDLYAQLASTLGKNRPQLAPAKIKTLLNRAWFGGGRAKKDGLVDRLIGVGQMRPWLNRQFPGGCTILRHYGVPHKKGLNLNSPFALFQLLSGPPAKVVSNKPAIAVIYADGVIVDDSPATDHNNSMVTPARMKREITRAVTDPRVKAIVLRIDSPGGSAAASDAIWHMLRSANKQKPVTVSMGSEAASGGYYIACAGRTITADPGTITGSIGVVGGKVVISGLLKKVGIHLQTFSHGKGGNANLFSATAAFTPAERQLIVHSMIKTYRQFTGRVLAGRGKKKIPDIQKVARGRVFAGTAGVQAGLVDNLGSLHDCIAAAAKKAHIAQRYQILLYPKARSLSDLLRRRLASASSPAPMPATVAMALDAMPRYMRKQTLDMLQMVNTLRQDRLLLAMPVGLVEGH